jgi:hypothetical protein
MPFEIYHIDVICNKARTRWRCLRQSGDSRRRRAGECARERFEAIDVRDNQFMIVARAP